MYLATEANETLGEDELEWQFNGQGVAQINPRGHNYK
jgi:hypothetical protein